MGAWTWTRNELEGWLARAMREKDRLPTKAIAEKMVASTQKTIRVGGRPSKFKPLSDVTKAARKGDGESAKPLLDDGHLIRSFVAQGLRRAARWGTNLVKAPLLNFGGKAGRNKKVFVPGRRFIQGAFSEDKKAIEETIAKHFGFVL